MVAEKGAEAKFTLKGEDGISPAAESGARSLEDLRKSLFASEAAIKELSAAHRRLRGSTDEVKQAKAELTGKLNAARASVSQTQLAMLKAGTSASELAERTKAAAAQQAAAKVKTDALGATVTRVGGPIANLRGRLGEVKEALLGASSASGIATIAFVGVTAAIAALAAAAVTGAAKLARWVIEGANAARTAQLMREAVTGSAQNATNLGDQVDVLSKKVSTSKAALNEMALALGKVRISGRAQVDTLNAVAQAADAMGDDVGNKLKDLVTRSQLTQRMFVSPQELFGTGLEFNDIAGELAKQLGVGIEKARAALYSGQVKLDDGAKALRSAVEKRFGSINARKLLDLNVMSQKLHERWTSLTSGVDLEPLLRPMSELLDVFDSSTVTGAAMKEIITDFGKAAVKGISEAIPYVKKLVQGVVIGSLEMEIAYLKVRNALKKAFGDKEVLGGVDKLQLALDAGKVVAYGFEGALLGTYVAVKALAAVADDVIANWKRVFGVVDDVRAKLGLGWDDVGKGIVEGLLAGLIPGGPRVVEAVKGLATSVKDAFSSKLKIQSPSRVFEGYGANTAEGFAQGVEGGTGRASSATAAMVEPPSASSSPSGRSGGAASVTVNVAINVTAGGGGGAPQDTAKALSDPGFLAQLTRSIEEALLGAGITVG